MVIVPCFEKRRSPKEKLADIATAGSIIYRQRGTKIYPGVNTMKGGDDTIFATCDGIVKYERWGKNRTKACVYPVEAK